MNPPSQSKPDNAILNYLPAKARTQRPPRSPVILILFLGLLLLPLLILLASPMASLFPQAWDTRGHSEVSTTLPGPFTPKASFQIITNGIGRSTTMRMLDGYIVCDSSQRPGCLAFDLQNSTCKSQTYQGQELGQVPLSRQAVLVYVSRAGYMPQDPELTATTDAIWSQILQLKSGPHQPQSAAVSPPYLSPSPGTFEYTPTERRFLKVHGFSLLEPSPSIGLPWYTPWILPVWPLAWFAIARPILRRHRDKLQKSKLPTGSLSRQ